MATIARIPISNVRLEGDFTGRIYVGPQRQPLDVILDTGSSALAIDGNKYAPAGTDVATRLAQSDSYGDGSSWTGAVLQTAVTIGDGASSVTLAAANVAVAYDESRDMFSKADGILGLAYAPLDDAYELPDLTWPKKYTATEVQHGKATQIVPYLSQLASQKVVFDKFAFYARRSFMNVGAGAADDPLNQGWLIVGGGEEATDLYTGAFQGVKVLDDEWYSTRLKAIVVGDAAPIAVGARGAKGMPSNSIVDSGTNTLDFGPQLYKAVLAKFAADQAATLDASVRENRSVAVADLRLADWPALTFVMQGETADVALRVAPADYWQVDSPKAGAALAAITIGTEGQTILGLPVMTGYFTLFDGEADNGRGVVRFATSKR